jgi:hypothetical protein
MGRSHHGEEWGFEVPGGFVTTKLRGGVPLLDSVIRSSWASARGAEQDIVIQNRIEGTRSIEKGLLTTSVSSFH